MRFIFSVLLFPISVLQAQDTLMPMIFLDDIVISEENNGFSIEDFVDCVKEDTTFYMGFKHLRYYSHIYESELSIFNKKGDRIGKIMKSGYHYSDGVKAWVINNFFSSEGNIFKRNGDYRYYTPEAFDEVFFPEDTINVSLNISEYQDQNESQNMRDAKTVGFSIGTDDVGQSKGGVSRKLAIFDINMQQYYDYVIGQTIYKNRDCYTFTIEMKKDLSKKDVKKVLIRNIVSYFDKENFNVVYREYKFVYKNWFLDLDMDVIVEMDYVNGKHVPTDIYYNGYWNVIFFKPERAEFRLNNSDFIIN